eukprot:33926_1
MTPAVSGTHKNANAFSATCMKQNMTASGERCVISFISPSPASSTTSFLIPSGPYPNSTHDISHSASRTSAMISFTSFSSSQDTSPDIMLRATLQALCHNRHAAAADETPISPPTFALCSPLV